VRTIAPMPLRSGYAVVLFNSDGPMLLFFRPDQQSASVLNKGDLCEDRIPREGAREVASGKLGIQMAV
jgi:hypothetical protein